MVDFFGFYFLDFSQICKIKGRDSDQGSSPAIRRSRKSGGDRSPFNPVIVLRGTTKNGASEPAAATGEDGGGFKLYYDDGVGSGLRPLPVTMSECLLGSGFDRLLDQLSQIEANGTELHCAVCKEAFEFGTEARKRRGVLTIWRLPGGGFAVGRLSGGRRGGEREFPVVYTERMVGLIIMGFQGGFRGHQEGVLLGKEEGRESFLLFLLHQTCLCTRRLPLCQHLHLYQLNGVLQPLNVYDLQNLLNLFSCNFLLHLDLFLNCPDFQHAAHMSSLNWVL